MKEVFLNLENEVLTGNVLDIGFDNYGIVYNMYKPYNDEIALEYYEGYFTEDNKKGTYDSCIMMFALNNVFSHYEKNKILKSVFTYLKPQGVLVLWDYEKPFMKMCKKKIKIMVPNRNLKEFMINNFNLFSKCSEKNALKMLENYFEIVDEKHSDEIYCIKAKKKAIVIEKDHKNIIK